MNHWVIMYNSRSNCQPLKYLLVAGVNLNSAMYNVHVLVLHWLETWN